MNEADALGLVLLLGFGLMFICVKLLEWGDALLGRGKKK